MVWRQRTSLLWVLAVVIAAGCAAADSSAARTGSDSGTTTLGDAVPSTVTTMPATASTAAATTSTVTGATTSTAATTSTTATTTTLPPPRTLTAVFTGDVLVHSHIWTQAQRNAASNGDPEGYDFTPMFDEIRPLVSAADFAVCHLEVPLRLPGREPSTHPFYGAPAEIIGDLADAGYDHCSTASNHTLDQGVEGIDVTLAEFDAVGITQSGMARVPAEIEPRVLDVATAEGNRVAVSHLSYTWSYNGLQPPEDQQWRSALIEPERIITDARTARAMGAEVVIVSLHWGAEKVHAVTGEQRRWAREIVAADVVDLIVGHHAHVVQPIEEVDGTWVAFGLSNVLSFHPTTDEWPAASQDAGVLAVSFTVEPDGVMVSRPTFHPTWVDKTNGRVIRDVAAGLADETTAPWLRDRLASSLARTSAVVGDFIVE